jgi:hypothetical protein
MILDDAIIELFDQGIYSPEQIDRLLTQRGQPWLRQALLERSSKLIRHHARDLAGRRTVLLTPRAPAALAGERPPAQEIYGALEWLPGYGYKPLGDFTADELRAAAAYKRQLAGDVLAQADRLEELANEISHHPTAKIVSDLGVGVAA